MTLLGGGSDPPRRARASVRPTPLDVELAGDVERDLSISVQSPALGTAMSIPASVVTEETYSTRMRIHTFSATIPAGVTLEVSRDGGLWFRSAGDENGDFSWRGTPLEAWPVVRGSMRFRWNNTNAAAQSVRAQVLGMALARRVA